MIRTRLTLWNAVVFALALTLIGVVVFVTTRTALYRSIDDDLILRATTMQRMSEFGPPMFGPGPMGVGGRAGPGPDGPGGPGDHGPGDRGPGGRDYRDHGPGGPPGQGDGMSGPGTPNAKRLPFEQEGVTRSIVPRALRTTGPVFSTHLMQLSSELDPIQAKRLEFSMRLGRPRFFIRSDQAGPPPDAPLDSAAVRAAFNGAAPFTNVTIEGRRVRIYTVPTHRSGKVDRVIQFAANLDDVDKVISRLGTILLALLPLALLATTGLGVWLTNRALRPVLDISEAAEKMETTNLSERLPVRGKDEFAVLSTRFNSMLDRIQGSFSRLETAYETQRQFVADASHELKTPLTTVKGRVGVALRGTHSPERYGEHLRAIGRAADNMSVIIQDLLLLARSDEAKLNIQRVPTPVAQLAREAIAGVACPEGHDIRTEIPDDLMLACEPTLVTRALTNLLSNALRHTSTEGEIAVHAEAADGQVRIAVRDQGEGIPAEHVDRVFDRFHRVDSSRDRASGGTGLGLSIVRSIVEAHGGRVGVVSEVGKGSTFTMIFPVEAP